MRFDPKRTFEGDVEGGADAPFAFVATNSLCQGQQAPITCNPSFPCRNMECQSAAKIQVRERLWEGRPALSSGDDQNVRRIPTVAAIGAAGEKARGLFAPGTRAIGTNETGARVPKV